jgi:SAM-dependent methyltransferase
MSTISQANGVRTGGLPGRDERRDAAAVPCQICGAGTVPGLDLGHQPIGDLLIDGAGLNEPETFYPMRLQHCLDCGLAQLSYIVDPAVVYKNFPFVSGTTQTATRHLQSLPPQLVSALSLDESSFAVDIGSNDGTLLQAYVPYGVKFLGVDPAGDPVRIANEAGIPTMHAFFNEPTAQEIVAEHGQAQAITACGVFAHIADLTGVMRGVKTLLAPGGIFATDSQYWLDMVLTEHYDNIFHQHLRYYSMRSLIELFRRYDMDVYDVERSDVYGGSIRVFSCHAGDHPISPRVTELVELEEREELFEPATFERFARVVDERRRRLFAGVYEHVQRGGRVIGIGAPAKASTVCNYCDLGPELLEYITEVNPLRIGMYLPGVHIPVIDEAEMFEPDRAPDAAVLFAWNYYDEIMPKLRARGFEGEVLLP